MIATVANSMEVASMETLIGTHPNELQVEHWINSKPLTLKDLKGKVVLTRWWTAPDCPFCSASSTALNDWYEKYRDQDFVVIGLYHHKKSSPISVEQVKNYVLNFRFEFPVAIDTSWLTLKQWWVEGQKRDWTSVSFLLDRNGVIRHIHQGGSYIKGDKEYQQLEDQINLLLGQE